MTARRRLVRVPASSANLGPGYDVFAAALGLHLELEVEETGSFSVDAGDLDVPADRSNLCVRAFEWLRPADEIAFRIRSDIPLIAGLGSSAAAIVAGLMAADHLYELALESADLLSHAAEIEGHPDNVAAAIYGGFVLAYEANGIQVARGDVDPEVRAAVFIPDAAVATGAARRLLPNVVPHVDAAANSGRAGLVVHALARDPDRLLDATHDWLHQGYREPAMPRSYELMTTLRSRGYAAMISGAGPSVLVLGRNRQLDELAEQPAPGFQMRLLNVGHGARTVMARPVRGRFD